MPGSVGGCSLPLRWAGCWPAAGRRGRRSPEPPSEGHSPVPGALGTHLRAQPSSCHAGTGGRQPSSLLLSPRLSPEPVFYVLILERPAAGWCPTLGEAALVCPKPLPILMVQILPTAAGSRALGTSHWPLQQASASLPASGPQSLGTRRVLLSAAATVRQGRGDGTGATPRFSCRALWENVTKNWTERGA